MKKLVRGRYRTQKWLHARPPEALADAVQSFFPGVPPTLLRPAVARYRGLGIWGRNPILSRAGFDRLKAGLVSGHFVRQGAPFEEAVDNSLAEEVVREGPPPLE
jgi:NitT/TauT family transport system substrate-binding protein